MITRRRAKFATRSQAGSVSRRGSPRAVDRRARVCRFEALESRLALSAGAIDGRPYIDLGPSDNVAWDQPRVAVELLTDAEGTGSVGPGIFNTFLLDTGANSILVFASAVADMMEPPHRYQTEGKFEEFGVAGPQLFDISAPYRFDFAGTSGVRRTLLDTRVISDADKDLSIFGPWGIVGMPAMADRVTKLDFTPWTTVREQDLLMQVDFPGTLPEDNGHRYSIAVDNRVSFDPEPSIIEGDHPPAWGDIPFLTGQLVHNDMVAEASMLFDTGAQVSLMSTELAKKLGLDSNQDDVLDERDANFARTETVGGIGGMRTVPVFLFDEIHIPTEQGPDLVSTDLQWLILDIAEGIDAVFGFDNITSGWIEAFAIDGQSGNIMESYLDFRDLNETGTGTVHIDLNPEVHQIIDPDGPGAEVVEGGDSTVVSETGVNDTYQIRLTQPPTSDVVIALRNQDGQLTAVDGANPSNSYLIFTPSNWNNFQTVVVAAADDENQEGFRRSWIRHKSSSDDPSYDGVGMPRVVVSVVDDDFAGVMIIPTDGSTEVAEGGPSDSYDVVLTRMPGEDVTIHLENVPGQVTAADASSPTGDTYLTFTPSNWNVPQTVLVRAVDDDMIEENHRGYITHRIATGDTEYQQAFVLQEIAWITDNDSADDTAPNINALSPPDNATGVSTAVTPTITFNEMIRKGTGEIIIKTSDDGSIFERIPAASDAVTVSGRTATIRPTAAFEAGTSYDVEIASGSFQDLAGNDFAGITDQSPWSFTTKDVATVVSRLLFYNNSVFDGADPAIDSNPTDGFADFAAIATDKTSLLPGETATFANYSSYSRGINGIVIDIAELADEISAADFEFHVGNDDRATAWPLAPNPESILVLAGAGVDGSDRIMITWPDGEITKQWLRVTVRANANTGLTAADVHYWGNWVGEAGNATADTKVNVMDQLLTRLNFSSSSRPATISSRYDFNRDGKVNTFDQLTARINYSSSTKYLRLISPPGTPAEAPQTSDDASSLATYWALVDLVFSEEKEELMQDDLATASRMAMGATVGGAR